MLLNLVMIGPSKLTQLFGGPNITLLNFFLASGFMSYQTFISKFKVQTLSPHIIIIIIIITITITIIIVFLFKKILCQRTSANWL